jgi:hypothetical protein
MRCLYVIGALLLLSSPALADDLYEPIMPVRPLTMADPAGLTALALELQYTKWNERNAANQKVDVEVLTFDLVADITLAEHWQIVGRMPFAYASIDDPMAQDCCELGLGNLTLGGRGLWSAIYSGGLRSVVGGELNVSLPTANDSGERAVSADTAAFAFFPKDPGRYAPDVATIRFNILAQFYSRWFLLHTELGPQLFIFNDDANGNDDKDLAIHLGVGAGIRATYTLAVLAELNAFLLDFGDGNDDSLLSVDLGLRYASGGALFGVRLYLPLDDGFRNLDMIGAGFDAGLRF